MSRRLVVEADGGSRGNPGPAGYGALVRDADTGELLAERAAGIGRATNNVAEYGGLIAGLQAALTLDPAEVEVRMDSKLVVEQMSGRWQVKHPSMKPLAAQAGMLVRQLPRVRFTWIPRAANSHADRLANEAMDAQGRGQVWRAAGDSGPADAADAWLTEHEPMGISTTPGTASTGSLPVGTASTGSSLAGTASTGSSLAGTAWTGSASADSSTATGWAAPTGRATTTLLLRHGQTALSVDKRFSGIGEQPLTEVGRVQAAAAADRLATSGAVAVIASPLTRTRQTAELVAAALGVDITFEPDLRETDFGAWEGCTFGEIHRRWPEQMAAWLADTTVAPPDGESFAAVQVRVQSALDRVRERWVGERVVLVSHVTPIKTLLRLALQAPPSALYRMHLDLACLSEISWYADGPTVVRSMNDTGHLPG